MPMKEYVSKNTDLKLSYNTSKSKFSKLKMTLKPQAYCTIKQTPRFLSKNYFNLAIRKQKLIKIDFQLKNGSFKK